jgi:predicted nuclease of predicted toxin-antitoxin system
MLKFLIDENLRNRAIWQAIVDWQTKFGQSYPLDVIRVGQSPGPPTETSDENLLEFCAAQNRILVSLDKDTLADELAKRLEVGNECPGIILLHGALSAGEIAEMLALASHACEPAELANRLSWLP